MLALLIYNSGSLPAHKYTSFYSLRIRLDWVYWGNANYKR